MKRKNKKMEMPLEFFWKNKGRNWKREYPFTLIKKQNKNLWQALLDKDLEESFGKRAARIIRKSPKSFAV